MDITVDIPADEMLLAAGLRRSLAPQIRSVRWMGVVLLVLSPALYLLFDPGAKPDPAGVGVALIAPVGVGLLGLTLLVTAPLSTVASGMRILRQSPGFGVGARMRITDAGVRMVSPLVDVSYAWAAFSGVDEVPGALLLMSGRGFLPVPLRELPEPRRRELRDFLAARIRCGAGRDSPVTPGAGQGAPIAPGAGQGAPGGAVADPTGPAGRPGGAGRGE